MGRVSEEVKSLHRHKYNIKRREHSKLYYREWYSKNGRKRAEGYTKYFKKYDAEHPTETHARYIVNNRLRAKKNRLIKPEECEKCKRKVRLSAHHEDYSKPLDIVWLCSSCHKLIHLNNTIDIV